MTASWAMGMCGCGRWFLRFSGGRPRESCEVCRRDAIKTCKRLDREARRAPRSWTYGACALPGCCNLWRSKVAHQRFCSPAHQAENTMLRAKLRVLTFDDAGRVVEPGVRL